MKFNRVFLTFLLTTLFASSFGQFKSRPFEYGKVDLSWWSSDKFKPDSSASAIILFAHGVSIAEPYVGIKQTVTRIIMILNKSALKDWGDVEISLREFRLTDFEARVHNLENGKIITSEVGNDAVLEYNLKKKVKRSAIPLPNVREGSIIEYRYEIKLALLGIVPWTFQHSIPVLWSEYEVFYPMDRLRRGILATITGLYDLDPVLTKRGKYWRRYLMTDLPAFSPEPLMHSRDDYISGISFFPLGSGQYIELYKKDLLAKYGIKRDTVMMDTKTSTQANFQLTEQGELVGDIMTKMSGYESILARKFIGTEGEEAFLKKNLNENLWTITKKELISDPDTLKDMVMKYHLAIPHQIENSGDLIYINPYVDITNEENKLTLEKRKYPIDFGSRVSRNLIVAFAIPDGYEVETLPANTAFELPKKDATFRMNVSQIGSSVYITSVFKTSKIVFNIDEYPGIKDFFAKVISKKSEPIVLRKKKN